jgi:hypothetical protein
MGELREVAYQKRSNSPTMQAQRWKTAEMAKKLSVRVAKLTCHKKGGPSWDCLRIHEMVLGIAYVHGVVSEVELVAASDAAIVPP